VIFLQIILVSCIFLALLAYCRNEKKLTFIIATGFLLRALAAVLDSEFDFLPWSGRDSIGFYASLIDFTKTDATAVLYQVPISSSRMYPWVLSWPARALGTEYLFLVFSNVLLGTFSILQMYYLARLIMPRRDAIRLAWVACLFPVSIVLSAVFLREAVVAVCILAALRQFIKGVQERRGINFVISAFWFAVAACFHGAIILCLVILPASYFLARLTAANKQQRGTSSSATVLLIGMCTLLAVIAFGPKFSKVGTITDLDEVIDSRIEREARRNFAKNSDYPLFLSKNIFRPDIAMIRYCYFLFAPFPWSWRGPVDVAGASFGFLNASALFLIWRHRRQIHVSLLTLAFFFLITSLMFSAGVNNVGTAIRHRNKVLPALLCGAIIAFNLHRGKGSKTSPQSIVNRRLSSEFNLPHEGARF